MIPLKEDTGSFQRCDLSPTRKRNIYTTEKVNVKILKSKILIPDYFLLIIYPKT